MVALTLHCLGQFTVTLGQQPLSFRTDKVRALLAYLALEARPHRRETLAALLWPDIGEAYAQKNLRNTFHRLRQPLQAHDPALAEQLLTSTRQTITLDPAYLLADVQQFEALVSASTTHARSAALSREEHVARCADCLARLMRAADLYTGELLAGFTLADAPIFEEWLVLRREALHQQIVLLLFDLAVAHDTRGEGEPAQHYARRLLALEPWREEAHRFLMRLLAQGGQRSAALAQYEQCRLALQREFGIEPAAETRALAEAIRRGDFDKVTGWQGDKVTARPVIESPSHLVTLSPPHPVTPSPPHNLPAASTLLIGRTQALAEIASRLQAQATRLLTLVGLGGMGKTSLALAAGREQLTLFADGVFFVALAAINTPAALAPTIASVLGLSVQGGDPRTMLLQTLRAKHLLLILDNFEHLLTAELTAVDLVVDLLAAAPRLQIMVTSRERLKLRSEQLYPVQPLAFAASASLAEAAALPAVRLFVQATQRSQTDFQLTAGNLAAVLRICRLVQGMPLGLELAAANAAGAPLSVIADAIAQSAEFLTVDWRDMPERQRSMRAVFAWSWQRLSPGEQRILRQCAVFRGGFTYAAAQAVTDATLPLLTRLTDKSLLQWQATGEWASAGTAPRGNLPLGRDGRGEGRYAMHELLRQFAAEELNAAGERPLAEERHGHYYLAELAASGLRLGRAEPQKASAEIQAELDNVRQAWHWAATAGRLGEIEGAIYGWWQFYQFQGLVVEGRQSFALAVAGMRQQLARTAGDTTNVLRGQRLLAALLASHADQLFALGRDEEMAAQAQEAIQLGVASGSIEGHAYGSFVLGRALHELGRPHEAGELWRQTIQLIRAYHATQPARELLHDLHWRALVWLRGSALHFGDYTGSRAYMVQALELAQTLGKRLCELQSLACLGQTDFYLFDFARGEPSFRAALDLARPLGLRRVTMDAQEGLGVIAWLRGDYTTALSLLEAALTIAQEAAFNYDKSMLLARLVRLHCQLGNQPAATQQLEQLTQLLALIKLPRECRLAGWLAAALQAHYAGDAQSALRYAEEANQQNEQGEILFRLVDTALILGHTRAAVAQWAGAAAAFQQALAAFQQFGKQALAAEPQAGLAQIALAQGDLAGARAQIEAILPVLAEQPHAGYNNPFFIYLTAYRVLAANDDPRAAPLLQQGYDLLQQAAAALDEESRRRFLAAVPSHRALVAAYDERLI
ncbi:MAG: hypothetical protein DYG89_27990 [Caldilinea sp. CFX5]|nr:hypothetical protein [Caldilinea sp. CFX5]